MLTNQLLQKLVTIYIILVHEIVFFFFFANLAVYLIKNSLLKDLSPARNDL